jgi:peptide/nickel transport system substrate-binding protein
MVLAAGGLTGAALLAACGSDDNDSGGGSSSKLVSKPKVSENAKAGGLLNISKSQDQGDWDPLAASGAATTDLTAAIYSRLLKHKVGVYPDDVDGSVEGDAAKSWEISPDAMKVTLTLRDDMKWDNRAPTSGRAMTSEDVKFSWDKFAAKARLKADLANVANKASPILSVETPGPKQVTFNMAFPYAAIEDLLAWPVYLQLMPKESDGGFDPRTTTRGSGAWYVDEYVASQVVKLRKNKDWYEKSRPYVDGLDMFIIDNTTTGITQLEGGNLAYYPSMLSEDIVPTKKRRPELQMFQKTSFGDRGAPTQVALGTNPGSPFLDIRVRQALSMLMDRETWMATFFNLDRFRQDGLDVPYRIMTQVPPGMEGYWIDPSDKAFGPGAKYYQYDPAEAKKMLSAATGGKLPIQMPFTWTSNGYEPVYAKYVEVTRGMLEANGDFKFDMKDLDYQTGFRFDYSNSPGKYDGIILSTGRSAANMDLYLYGNWHHAGSKPKFTDPDVKAEELMAKQRTELDPDKRKAIVLECLAHVSEQMHFTTYGGEVLDFSLAQPYVGNYGAYNSWYPTPYDASWFQEAITYYWYDESKVKKS